MKGSQNKYYIVCEDLFKIYKIADLEVVALRGLDLKVETGELMAIVGASGSGKSTLLNILGGLDVPSAGQVVVGNRDLLKTSSRDLVDYRRQDVGFVWQQTSRNVISYLTAYQNVELPLILLGWPIRKRRRRVEEMLEAVGLTHRSDHFPDRLSGGEQQRVAIAVALAHNPPLLLADEPTGELDSHTSETVLDVFRSVNETYGVTVVIVTHDIRIINKVNRVVTIRDGRTSQETIRKPQTEFTRPDERSEETYDEFIVVDGAGRLQIPRDVVEKLKLGRRVRVLMEDDHLAILPVESQEGEEK
jgi:ABC-type lipoprotein export system ATPase subunit